MKKLTLRRLLRVVNHYVVFFLMVGFVTTCCMSLFLSTLTRSAGIVFTEENIGTAAKLTFGNVLLITALFVTIDYVRRKLTVDLPVKRITQAAQRITEGDFSVRIEPLRGIPGEDGFNQIIQAVNQMAQELSGIETLRSDFIANVSHELKTPLAVMGNYAVMLRQPGITQQEREEYATAISETAQRLARLISNILKLNKLENQQIFPRKEEFDLAQQLCESLLQYEELWEKKNISIEAEIEDAVKVTSDRELLGLVWNNLISNAVKFTPEGGSIGISLTADTDTVTVCVWDTGCGMKPEVGRHIFEKFYQGDTSHASQGNGLGLALVKRVMDILGGQIQVQSTLGKGSAFTVRLRRR